MPEPRFIVAEVSKTWTNPEERSPELLSQRFEHIINVNHERGYALRSWQPTQNMESGVLVETIVAVFESVGR